MLRILEKILRVISYTIISVIVLLVLFVGYLWAEGKYTYWRDYSYKPIKKRATQLTKVFDRKRIEDFDGWDCHRRGVYIFSKDTNAGYSICFSNQDDTLKLELIRLRSIEAFNKDFGTHLKSDSALLFVNLYQCNDTLVNVAYTMKGSMDTVYDEYYNIKQLFPDKNPFTYFNKLKKVIDSGKIIAVYHYEGNLCLILSDMYKLYYMPNLSDDSSRKAFLKRIYCEYESIERIAQGWYLIKLSEPLDFG